MSIQSGGLLGRPSGKIAGIVFGSARSRSGKVVTAREKVNPSNPNTAAQQAQRTAFQRCLDTVKDIGPTIYQEDWNRAVSQLPGFQSWMSLLLTTIDNTFTFSAPSDVSLGNLHYPETVTIAGGTENDEIDVTWSTENGDNGTTADVVKVVAYSAATTSQGIEAIIDTSATRTDGGSGVTLTVGTATGEYIVCVYLSGEGTADGLLSLATFELIAAGPE